MTPAKLFVVAAVGLSATACSYSNTTTAAAPVAYRSGAEQACLSYGFKPGTDSYNRCVVSEAQSRATTVYTPAPVTTVYAPAPAATVYTQGPVTYAPAAQTPPAGVQAFRDEYGFRYDGQGNRIDSSGNIISPQSTRP
ncbi:MAG TPA: hypothetical protein VF949_05370 [Reyranella sp.]